MGCTIPGCGATDHNRRTHDRHVPPQTDALLDQPETGEVSGPTGADRAREALAAARAIQDDADGVMVMVWGVEKWAPAGSPAYAAAMAQRRKDAAAASPVRCTACDVVLKDGESFLCSDCSDPGQAAAEDAHDRGDPMLPGPDDYDPGQADPTNEEIWPTDGGEGLQPAGQGHDEWSRSAAGDHECEPSPDQVWFCRHCGEDLADPDDPGLSVVYVDSGYPTPPWRTVLGPDEPIRITMPGVYQLEASEYHDPKITGDWLSNTDAKQLTGEGVPAQYRYDKDHGVKEEKDVWELGKAIHAKILGKGDEVVYRPLVDPLDPNSEWNDWRKNAAKAWRAVQQGAGRIVLTPDQQTIVDGMADAIHVHPEAARLLAQPGRPEVCLFWIDQATGVRRRCMVDYLPDAPNAVGLLEIVDVKSADKVAPTEKLSRKIYDNGYHRQQATIVDAVIALGLAVDAEVTFLFQAKNAPYLVTPVVLDTNAQRIGAIQNREAINVYAQCMETGNWPGFSDRPVIMNLPYFIEREYQEDIGVND